MVPYFIKHLGTDGYGFIPLATSVMAYVSLVTIALNGAVSRYLVIDLQKNDIVNANKTFNTAFWSTGILSVVFIPLIAVFVFFVPRIFNVPPKFSTDVQWLFSIIFVSFIVSVFSSVFSVSTFAHNRLDLRNAIDLGNLSTRTGLVVILFIFLSSSLFSVGTAYLVGSLIALWLSFFFFRRLTPELSIRRADFDRSKMKELAAMGGWLVINQIGSLFFLQIDLIVVNILLGANSAGQYAAILQWSVLLRSLAGIIAGVLVPMVLISHANNEKERIIFMSQKAVKFLGLGMAISVGLLCGFAQPLLRVWLGEDFVRFVPLLWLLTFHLVVNLAVLPLFAINTALNRVRTPGIVTLVMGIINLLLAIVFAKFFGWGMYGVAAAGAMVLTLKNAIFTPIYAAYILKINYSTFIKPIGIGVFWAMVNMGIGLILSYVMQIDGWPKLLCAGGGAFLLASLITVLLLGKDRGMVLSLLKLE